MRNQTFEKDHTKPVLPGLDSQQSPSGQLDRRSFLKAASLAVLGGTAAGCAMLERSGDKVDPIIDIHQHVGYSGRADNIFLAHQDAMGIAQTILLPAGRPMKTASTHDGISNGLQARALGNEACYQLARAYGKHKKYLFGANEVPDAPGALKEIERYLKRGAVVIGEQKFGVECDSAVMQQIYALAADYRVPVLMHWQFKMYNYGFERFHRMLQKFPKTIFLGHAQTFWAHVDAAYIDATTNLYPKGKIKRGGLTDKYLSDYPNMYGDLSASSCLNAFKRDEDHGREFLARHQNKLIYGSDCSDLTGVVPSCQGAETIAELRKLSPSKEVEHKLLWQNARRVFRI
jgi:predicted TIM-barrel fold metal-dependent hydrolase